MSLKKFETWKKLQEIRILWGEKRHFVVFGISKGAAPQLRSCTNIISELYLSSQDPNLFRKSLKIVRNPHWKSVKPTSLQFLPAAAAATAEAASCPAVAAACAETENTERVASRRPPTKVRIVRL